MTKKILIQVKDTPRTHWIGGDTEFRVNIRHAVEQITRTMTQGELPEITVVDEGGK